MKIKYTEKYINNWNDLEKLRYDHLKIFDGKWIYRGQSNCLWPLTTTLERACISFHNCLNNADIVELILLRDFKRRFHHYSQYIPSKYDDLEWLSLMQHYGAPTRLMDWSYSIYIALYFAIEKMVNEDAVIFAINRQWMIENANKIIKPTGKCLKYLTEAINEEHEKCFRILFMSNNHHVVCNVNPFRLNNRLIIQRGLFLSPGDVRVSFEDNLSALLKDISSDMLLKIIIPKAFRKTCLPKLYDMGISRESLFPGLDGVASTLSIYHPLIPYWNI